MQKTTTFTIPFYSGTAKTELPVEADVLQMTGAIPLADPKTVIEQALETPINCSSLRSIIKKKKESKESPKAVIVISDNTRPVPYKGESGILMPIIGVLMAENIPVKDILILVATGTHRPLTDSELRSMLDQKVFDLGIPIINHDCKDAEHLTHLGVTTRGTQIYIDSYYLDADIKILTGLVESHFMAGASGGRKSICPGLVGETGTFIFHGPEMLDHPKSTDLVLAGNPCHEEALEVAKAAGADFIVNVTLDSSFAVSGVFAGELEAAHTAAVEQVIKHIGVPFDEKYDVVISHAGFVGINHYQAAKTGSTALKVVKPGGFVILAAENIDSAHPVGALTYRTSLQLLKLLGSEKFMKLIKSPDWVFIPEQWQVQMWSKLFSHIPMKNFYYYSPQFTREHYAVIPGIDGSQFVSSTSITQTAQEFYLGALEDAAKRMHKKVDELSVCILLDGPYGIPVNRQR
jgi:lactate racemase